MALAPPDKMNFLVCQTASPELGRCNGQTFYVRYANSRQMYTCTKCGEIYENIIAPGEKDG